MDTSQPLAAWIRAGRPLQLHGHEIFVRTEVTEGREPLVLLHGYPNASYDWHHLWPALAERYSLYAFDMLGFGMSSKPRDCDYPIALQADLCEALLEHFGIVRPHVLAHDYGVSVAQELLARELEGRRGLASACFLNGGLFPETYRARPVSRVLAHPLFGPGLARLMTYPAFERNMRRLWGRQPPDAAELRDFWWLLVRNDGRRAIARLTSYIEQRREHRARWVGALLASKVPRRLLCGALDPVSGRHLAERYRELVPDADVVLFDDVGHYPHLEDPGAVLAAYLDFRDCLPARDATS